MNIAVVLAAVFLATGHGAHSAVPGGAQSSTAASSAAASTTAASSTAPPSPAVAITPSGPVLTQQSPTTWTTTVLLDEISACLAEVVGNQAKPAKPAKQTQPSNVLLAQELSYHLVTTSPDYVVAGTVAGTAEINAFPATGATSATGATNAAAAALNPATLGLIGTGALPPPCSAPADETASAETEVSLTFTLKAPFPTVPLTATLVIEDPGGEVPVTATQLMTVRALVTVWQYLLFPVYYAVAMVVAFVIGLLLVAWWRRPKREDPGEGENRWSGDPPDHGPGFWRRPVYASAAWSFTDSPATTISAAATVLATVLAGAGAASTLLPGIQVDHFAVLLAVWAIVVVAAPMVFGFLNTVTGASRSLVPDNAALLRFPGDQAVLHAPGGASLAFAGEATAVAPGLHVPLKPGGALPVPPDSTLTVSFAAGTGTMVLPGDSSVVLTGMSGVQVGVSRQGEFTAPPDAQPGQASSVMLSSGVEIKPPLMSYGQSSQDGVTVKAVGFITVTVPKGTRVHYPFPDQGITKTFSQDTYLRVPMGDKTIVANMWSLIPASLLTIFGIGAQLGLLGMLAGELSALPGPAHNIAWAIVGVMAAVMVGYSVVATAELASSRPGTALASDSQSSYIL